jgi:cardiolipin synthase
LDHFLWGLLLAAYLGLSLVSAGHALLFKRDPRAAFGWVGLTLTVPFIGPFLYWTMGINRIHRRAQRWLESGRRLKGWASFPEGRSNEEAAQLPPWGVHLNELRNLGDRVTKFPLLPGNRLVPLENGDQAYPAMLSAITDADHSVHLSTYIFDGDGTGQRFAGALKRAADRGVQVRVLVDSLGEKYSHPRAHRLLRHPKIKIGRFLPLSQGGYVNLRTHRKILVVDGCRAFTGGMNIGDRHLVTRGATKAPVIDRHFMIEGPVVADLQRIFLGDWHFVTGEIPDDPRLFPHLGPAGSALVRAIADGPDKEFRRLHLIILGALACARDRVQIMTPYFIPDQPLIASLVTTALRGIEVTLVLPARNNLPYVHWATRAYLWELLQHGIRILYQPPPFVHTKLLLVDGEWSLVGSANLDPRSLRLNFEFNLEVYDRSFTEELERDFLAAVARSREVSQEEMDARPMPVRLRDGVMKLFSPYL